MTEEGLLHELDVMQAAGIGGIEINPVGLPGGAERTDDKPLDWLSPEWNRMLKLAIDGAEQRGMVVDMIVGSGWPFGGRFLDNDETIQGVVLNIKQIDGPGKFTFEIKDLMTLRGRKPDRTRSRLMFLRLIPQGALSWTEEEPQRLWQGLRHLLPAVLSQRMISDNHSYLPATIKSSG